MINFTFKFNKQEEDGKSSDSYFSKIPSKITDSIYQGAFECSMSKKNLESLGITHILVAGDLQCYFPEDFIYKKFIINDSASENIFQYFEEAYTFLDECIDKSKGKVLVHCAAGISRSSAFTLCYLMRKNLITFKEALGILQKQRPVASPNPGFQSQLKEWERVYVTNEYV